MAFRHPFDIYKRLAKVQRNHQNLTTASAVLHVVILLRMEYYDFIYFSRLLSLKKSIQVFCQTVTAIQPDIKAQ